MVSDLTPEYKIGDLAEVIKVCIRGTKMRFPYKNGTFRAETNYYANKWADMGWSHEACVAYIEKHKTRKDNYPNFKWSYDIKIDGEIFEIVKPLIELEDEKENVA